MLETTERDKYWKERSTKNRTLENKQFHLYIVSTFSPIIVMAKVFRERNLIRHNLYDIQTFREI